MYVRGSDQNIEYKREVNSFFRGIVIDDSDPNKMQRVKVFIPELVNIDYTNELKSDEVNFIAPSKISDLNPEFHKLLLDITPWAEQASGLFGERGLSNYSSYQKDQLSKGTYVKDKTANKVPNSKEGGLLPRMSIANKDNTGEGSMIDSWSGFNPTAAGYAPVNSGPMASGIYGVPQVGAHVWVFFDRGDINFPVYFATIPSYTEIAQVYNNGGYPKRFSTAYDIEKGQESEPTVQDTPPEPLQQDNLNRDIVTERTDFGNIDNETRRLLYELTQSEVGGQGRDAQIAFMETVSNRAAAERRSIYSIVTDVRYYEPLQRGITRPVSSTTQANYDSVFSEVTRGSNITKGATHNASAGVAKSVRAGGYNSNLSSIIEIGGETFYNKEFPREQNWLKRFNETS